MRIAALPADSDHRFGHGKAEALVALVQVMLIGVSALCIGWRAVDRLINGGETAEMELRDRRFAVRDRRDPRCWSPTSGA